MQPSIFYNWDNILIVIARVLIFHHCKMRNSVAEDGSSAESPRQAIRNSAENPRQLYNVQLHVHAHVQGCLESS